MGSKARGKWDESLAERIRMILGPDQVSERAMFGGLCFMVAGHMACGLTRYDFMVRVGPDAYEQCLALPHTRVMDFTGRPMRGMVYVDPAGLKEQQQLASWVQRGERYARSLPPRTR